jgi:hypothetical protein
MIHDPPQALIEPARPVNPEGKNLREEAELWMLQNPEAMAKLEELALKRLRLRKPFGMRLLFNVARWDLSFDYPEGDYKINDHHSPYIGRYLVEKHPALLGMLRFRKTRY